MMAMLGDFFVYMIMALTVENLLFTRGLGIGKTMMIVRKPTYLFSFTWVLSVLGNLPAAACCQFFICILPADLSCVRLPFVSSAHPLL